MSWVAVASIGIGLIQSQTGARTERELANASAQGFRFSAEQELLTAMDQARVLRKQGRQFVESQRSGFASAGVRVDSGSAQDVIEGTIADIEQDAAQLILSGQRRRSELLVQAAQVKAGGAVRAGARTEAGIASALQSGYSAWQANRISPTTGGGGSFGSSGAGRINGTPGGPVPGTRVA